MGFSVPAVSCMLSLPSNTSLFYLKMINDVAVNVDQPAAAPLHRRDKLWAPCVTGMLNTLNDPVTFAVHYAAGWLVLERAVMMRLTCVQLVNNMLLLSQT